MLELIIYIFRIYQSSPSHPITTFPTSIRRFQSILKESRNTTTMVRYEESLTLICSSFLHQEAMDNIVLEL
uniref:Uncharacterized protein n=1 Tax=Lepeophtheirus salmonis TaxID=72036 RepID=A0A0K2V6M6_LEPSM